MTIPVVLDTDVGNNIDDAFALALCATMPEIELLGVTTTCFQAERRALLARRLLAAYGRREVPVAFGMHERYLHPKPEHAGLFTQDALAQEVEPLSIAAPLGADDWLSDILHSRSDVTYVAVAPLTNLAAVLQKDHTLAKSLQRVVVMGGWFSQALPEWNIHEDPESAALVLNSGVPMVFVGYEVTLGCILTQTYLAQLRESQLPGARFLLAMYDAWLKGTGGALPILHDPLTLALLCEPTLVQLEKCRLSVQLSATQAYGVLQRDLRGHEAWVATSVDRNRYMRLLINRVCGCAPNQENSLTSLQVELRDALDVQYYPGWSVEDTAAQGHLLLHISSGSGWICHGQGREQHVGAGHLIYISQKENYSFHTDIGMTVQMVHFHVADDKSLWESAPLTVLLPHSFYIWGDDKASHLGLQIRRLIEAWRDTRPHSAMLCQGLLCETLALLAASIEQVGEEAERSSQLVAEAKMYLVRNSHRNIDLSELSQHLGVSKCHIVRLFSRLEQMPPAKYHRSMRIRQAKALLEIGNLPIKVIAHQLGFSSIQTFSRTFRNEVGLSPSEYQQLLARACASTNTTEPF